LLIVSLSPHRFVLPPVCPLALLVCPLALLARELGLARWAADRSDNLSLHTSRPSLGGSFGFPSGRPRPEGKPQ